MNKKKQKRKSVVYCEAHKFTFSDYNIQEKVFTADCKCNIKYQNYIDMSTNEQIQFEKNGFTKSKEFGILFQWM